TYDDQASTATSENCHIEKIWALQRIDFLKLLVLQQGETESLRRQIVSLGFQYGIVIEDYTGLVLTSLETQAEDSSGYFETTQQAGQTRTPTAPGYGDSLPCGIADSGVLIALGILGLVLSMGIGFVAWTWIRRPR
ncbi:MAG: hypothetical protein KGY80_09685, partial [Candidatus Thorarchaeota archaeon]|nr:hypothetical protein [Candidatus Thorarchaeota archaeon]